MKNGEGGFWTVPDLLPQWEERLVAGCVASLVENPPQKYSISPMAQATLHHLSHTHPNAKEMEGRRWYQTSPKKLLASARLP